MLKINLKNLYLEICSIMLNMTTINTYVQRTSPNLFLAFSKFLKYSSCIFEKRKQQFIIKLFLIAVLIV